MRMERGDDDGGRKGHGGRRGRRGGPVADERGQRQGREQHKAQSGAAGLYHRGSLWCAGIGRHGPVPCVSGTVKPPVASYA
jgi:hypothetical protein